MNIEWIEPAWPAPPAVRVLTTLRRGGVSTRPYDSLNLARHVGDDADRVARNRARLAEGAALPAMPRWLAQVHGSNIVEFGSADGHETEPQADGAISRVPGTVLAVLTADCLPIMLCNREGTEIAALHAGWRGLASGIVAAGLAAMRSPRASLLAWLGPAVCGRCYEVGDEVRTSILTRLGDTGTAFTATRPGHWLADLPAVARLLLAAGGVGAIHGGDRCTLHEPDSFFSHRRDGVTGRMATLIYHMGRAP